MSVHQPPTAGRAGRAGRLPDGPYPPEPAPAGRVLDARLHLLDRQVLDHDRVPVTTVDDLEVVELGSGGPDPGPQATPVISALLTGAVLATRIAGGRPPSSRWIRIPWRDVAELGTALRLGVSADGLDASWTERWVRDRLIARIPGGRHDPQ